MLPPLKISVVTAVLNDRENVRATLRSVAQQVCQRIEIQHIVIDGASTDGTGSAIDGFIELQQSLCGISYVAVHEPDRGIYDAMDKGRRLATGDFIYFLNAGDRLSSTDVLARTADCIKVNYNGPALYFGQVCITSKHACWHRPRVLPKTGRLSFQGVAALPHHQATFYPRSYYRDNAYDLRLKKYGDTDYTLRAAAALPCFAIPVQVAFSTLGGYSSKRHSWRESQILSEDFGKLARKHPTIISRRDVHRKQWSFFAKWLTDTLLGPDMKHLFMAVRNRKAGDRAQAGTDLLRQ